MSSSTCDTILHNGFVEFQEALKRAEDIIRSADMSDADRAEGYIYLASANKYITDRIFSGFDLEHPHFVRCMDSMAMWGLGNPDNIFLTAEIRSDAEYSIIGERGTCADINIETLAGCIGDNNAKGANIDTIDLSRIDVDADGRFEIRIGGAPADRNWLMTRPDVTSVFARQTFGDWTKEVAGHLTIERIGADDNLFDNCKPELIARQWREAGRYLLDFVHLLYDLAKKWRETFPINQLTSPRDDNGSGYLQVQYSAAGQYKLKCDEALLIACEPCDCRYDAIAVGHSIWYTNVALRYRQTCLNTAMAHRSSDGRYYYVVSAVDPGVPNWIDTTDHETGFIFKRWQAVKGAVPARPSCVVLPISELSKALPADEPVVSKQDRIEAMRLRRRAVDHRFA